MFLIADTERPRGWWASGSALYAFRLKEVGAVGVMVSTLPRAPAIEKRRRNLST
jgi:hypothetical protein